ncbi:MAG TPA: hypothetical protein VGU66_08905 [Candidatus Elarobacter sp.]|nr:hypothetical protein [Candidatus Elarobacter sp.]
MAFYRSKINQIAAWCEHGIKLKSLNIAQYGHEFGIEPAKAGASKHPTWYRTNERQRFAILERDGFVCVWCREPITLEVVPQALVAELRVDDLAVRGAAGDWPADDLPQERTFFDSDADHLFTLDDITILKGRVDSKVVKLASQEWIVTACERCNRGRRDQPTPARSLLSIYARHLLERSGAPDWDDLNAFIGVLRVLRIHRTQPAATGTGE